MVSAIGNKEPFHVHEPETKQKEAIKSFIHLLQQPTSNPKETVTILENLTPYLSSPHIKKTEIQTIHAAALQILLQHPKISAQERAFIERCELACQLRERTDPLSLEEAESWAAKLQHRENKALLTKWKEANFDLRAFLYHPKLPSIAFGALFHRIHHFWGHEPRFNEKTYDLDILVEGKWVSASAFAQTISISDDPWAPGKIIYSKEDRTQQWIYLPNTGYTQRSDWNWKKLVPTGKLSPEQVEYAQKKAALTSKNGKENGDHVIEVFSSWKSLKSNPLTQEFIGNVLSPRHVWLRIIKPDGTWYSVGFNVGTKLNRPCSLRDYFALLILSKP